MQNRNVPYFSFPETSHDFLRIRIIHFAKEKKNRKKKKEEERRKKKGTASW